MPMLGVHKLINKDKIRLAISLRSILADHILPVIRALKRTCSSSGKSCVTLASGKSERKWSLLDR